MSVPLDHDYVDFSPPSDHYHSSMEKTGDITNTKPISPLTLNLKATELRLGLPGSASPERDNDSPELCIGFPTCKSSVSRPKRGFSVAIHGGSGNWVFSSSAAAGGPDTNFSSPRNNPAAVQNPELGQASEDGGLGLPPQSSPEKKKTQATGSGAGPASKAQVVGWPPIRSFRKNNMASQPTPKNSDVAEGGDHLPQSGGSSSPSPSSVCLYVKVSMDGAPYLRKVDLRTYGGYKDLSLALESMFSCFTIGQCGSHGVAGRDGAATASISESRLVDILHGSEYVLTYEDKDGDWMLVGDVPWKMFMESCRRLRIMKSSDAMGLAPRALEKCKSSN